MQGFIPPADHISNHCYKLTMCFFKDTLNLKQTVEKLCDDDVVGGEVLNAKIVMLSFKTAKQVVVIAGFCDLSGRRLLKLFYQQNQSCSVSSTGCHVRNSICFPSTASS